VKAAIVVGLIWGPWHAPMLAAGLNYSSVNPLAAIGIFVITATALSLLLTRAYLAAGGALLVPVLMHASFNRFGDSLTNTDHPTAGAPGRRSRFRANRRDSSVHGSMDFAFG
jgi:hypothetical protein